MWHSEPAKAHRYRLQVVLGFVNHRHLDLDGIDARHGGRLRRANEHERRVGARVHELGRFWQRGLGEE